MPFLDPHHDFPGTPLPGTERRPRGLFIDRWGTLLERPPKGYCARFEDARFVEGATDALFRAAQAGWRLYLIGNEEAVARGRWSSRSFERFEAAFAERLSSLGVPITRSYVCIDHPVHGKGPRKRDSVYLLPNTGAMHHARQFDGIDLAESWVIGDSTLELAAGWRAGCRTAGVRTGEAVADGTLHVEVDLFAEDLTRVVRHILAVSARAA